MNTRAIGTTILFAALLVTAPTRAQQIEAVYAVNFEATSRARAALDDLFSDEAMSGARATLYAAEFGNHNSSHIIVADFDSYGDYMERNQRRVASHGWSRYLLGTQDAEYVESTLVQVVDDHGAARHTAGYLVAFLIRTSDPATYRTAIADLDEALENPGVLRLVAMRSGSTAVTHAVLIGAEDFAAVAEYLDELFASEAFDDFSDTVEDIREVVSVQWYRRVATWGD